MNGKFKTANKLRIGLITHNYPTNPKESKDAGKFIYKFAQELSRVAEVKILCPDFGGEKVEDIKVPVTWFKWWIGANPKLGNLNLKNPLDLVKISTMMLIGFWLIIKFNRENKIDYNLCFWNFPSGVFGWVAKKMLNIHYATWALGSDIYVYGKNSLIKNLLIRPVIQNADVCYGNSYDICDHIKKIASVKTDFLPTSSPIDISNFKTVEKIKFRFLYLGRLEPVKGPDVLIEAAIILAKTTRNFEVVMIGAGSMQEELTKKVVSRGLSKNIKVLGYVEDQSLVNGYLLKSDCLVIPSRSESFPLVVTEALQVGLPIIGSDVGDMPHFIHSNGLGYIFPKEDEKSLARLMNKMFKESQLIKKSKKQTMKKLYSEFKLQSIARKFINSVSQ